MDVRGARSGKVGSDIQAYRRNPQIEEAPLQGELMLFDPGPSRFYVLNRTMAFVWRHCDGEHSLTRMVEGLATEFRGVERAAAEADLVKALEELRRLGLVIDSV